jgi:hypothetical protein
MSYAGKVLAWICVVGACAGASGALAGEEITGTVTFRRNVADSEPYWTAVIRNGTQVFEAKQPFGIGSPVQPMSMLVGGIDIFPGDRIRAQAVGITREPGNELRGNLDSVQVLSHGRVTDPRFPRSIYGWSCQSTSRGPLSINVSIFESEGLPLGGTYQLHVVAVRGEATGQVLYPLLKLQDVRMTSEDDNLVYAGATGTAQAEVSIRQVPGQIHLPSNLRLTRSETEPGDPLGPQSETNLVCTPTRNIDP